MKKYLIIYTSYVNFVFWFLPGLTNKKEVECKFMKSGKVYFRSEKYEGEGVKLNKYLSVFLRYLLSSAILLFAIPEVQNNKILFLSSLIFGVFITGFFIIEQIIKNTNSIKIAFLLIIGISLAALSFVFGFEFSMKSVMFSLQYAIFFWFLAKTILDFVKMKNKKIYCLCEQKILFYVENL